jgi:hypothetical protein
MPDLALRNNEGGATFALTLAMMGFTPETVDSTFVDLYWRFEDETTDPIWLGRGSAGETFQAPFDAKGRSVRIFAASITGDGKSFVSDFAQMAQAVYTPGLVPESGTLVLEASEDIAAGRLVNIFDDGGTAKIRKASAADNTKPAVGFVNEEVLSGMLGTVYFGGNQITALTGLAPGATYFLSATLPGRITTTAPTASGNIQQQIGEATSDITLQFEPQPTIEIA